MYRMLYNGNLGTERRQSLLQQDYTHNELIGRHRLGMESIDKNSLVIKRLGVYLGAPNSEYIGTPINGLGESK